MVLLPHGNAAPPGERPGGAVSVTLDWLERAGRSGGYAHGLAASQLVSCAHSEAVSQALVPPSLAM